MVGQLTLDQHIGVRIPGGQPILSNLLRAEFWTSHSKSTSILCEIGVIGENRRAVFTDVYHTTISTSALGKVILKMLHASECPTVGTASRPHYV